jgi:hypothetical protein
MTSHGDALEWPDAVEIVCAYLANALPTAEIGTRVPTGTRDRDFVLVKRVGGLRSGPARDVARIMLECWGQDEGGSATLVGIVREAMRQMRGTIRGFRAVTRGEVGGPIMTQDDSASTPYYLLTVDVVLMARPI